MRGFRGFPEAKAEIEWFGFTYSAIMPGGSFFSALFLLSLPTFINLWAANVIISLLFFLFRRSGGFYYQFVSLHFICLCIGSLLYRRYYVFSSLSELTCLASLRGNRPTLV